MIAELLGDAIGVPWFSVDDGAGLRTSQEMSVQHNCELAHTERELVLASRAPMRP